MDAIKDAMLLDSGVVLSWHQCTVLISLVIYDQEATTS
jgi:hypothetical protein